MEGWGSDQQETNGVKPIGGPIGVGPAEVVFLKQLSRYPGPSSKACSPDFAPKADRYHFQKRAARVELISTVSPLSPLKLNGHYGFLDATGGLVVPARESRHHDRFQERLQGLQPPARAAGHVIADRGAGVLRPPRLVNLNEPAFLSSDPSAIPCPSRSRMPAQCPNSGMSHTPLKVATRPPRFCRSQKHDILST
jgi:hypothetical protein